MIENISFVNFDLSVRKICLGSEQKFVAVTLGEGSYIVDASLEYGSLRCHVMVGKYCSIAHGIKFMIDVNHDTEAVSTYPFDVAFKQEAKEREFEGG